VSDGQFADTLEFCLGTSPCNSDFRPENENIIDQTPAKFHGLSIDKITSRIAYFMNGEIRRIRH